MSYFISILFVLTIPFRVLSEIELNFSEYSLTMLNNEPILITKQGYFRNLNGELAFTKFNSIPEQINDLKIYNLYFLEHKDSIFAVHPGGGYLYKIDGEKLIRVDRSRAHLNQFGSNIFSFKDTLYNLGGYGLWNSKSTLTYFDENLKSWDRVPTQGNSPLNGFSAAEHLIIDEILYLIGGEYTLSQNQTKVKTPLVLRLDLKTKTWLSELKLTSDAFKIIHEHLLSKSSSFIYNNKIVIPPKPSDPYFYQIDPVLNSVSISNQIKDVFFNDFFPMVVDGKLLEQIRAKNSTLVKFQFKSLPAFIESSNQLKLYRTSIDQSLLLASSSIGLILLLLVIKYRSSRRNLILTKSQLYYLGGSIPIKKSEHFFLLKLAQNKTVENQDLLNFFNDENRSSDLIIKRKNAMIDNLATRFFGEFKKHFFQKDLNPKDKRQTLYRLSNNFKISIES